MKNKFIYWCALITLVFLCLPVTALAADNPVGVAYRGHIQDVGDYPSDGSWVDSPEIIGTEGQSKRIEGFEIKLTGTIPETMEMRYNVHVQNKGWLYDEDDVTNWPKDGDYAGTRGKSLRIEAVKIVLTDSDGKPVSGYSVQYRGHVQNVGDLPADKSQWIADGDQLGTVGSSQRLEALLVKVVKTAVEPMVYDKAGTYGPETGTEVINGDVIIKADGITLRNLHINGDLYIGTDQVVQKVEENTAETINVSQVVANNTDYNTIIQNLYVAYFTRPSAGTSLTITGSPSQAYGFSLPGGTQFTAITPGTGAGTGAPMQITAVSSSGSAGGVSVGGAIGSLSLLTPGMQVSLAPGCQVQLLSVLMGAPNCGVFTPPTAVIHDLLVQGSGAIFSGSGAIQHADIQGNRVSFATRPGDFIVAPGVAIQPSMPALPDSGGSGGYTPSQNPVTFSPAGGAMTFPATVALSSTGAEAIYYTTDGSDPSTVAGATNTTVKTGATATITIGQAMTIKAIATRAGYYNSANTSATYTQAVSADLTSITLSSPTDNFTFAPETYNYPSVTVANDVEEIFIIPIGSGNGVITVNGNEIATGATSGPIPVSFQTEQTITIVNREQGKPPKTYTIKVTPSSGTVMPIVSKLKTTFAATATPLDLNTSGIFGIKPGTTGVLSNVAFTSSDQTIIASGTSTDGKIPIFKDGSVNLTFATTSVTLDGITYPDISLNNAEITITSTAYLAKVNSGTGTVADYAAAGITGVVDGNLSGINQAVAAARAAAAGAELNTDAIQTVVAGYLAGANNFTVALENSNSKIQTEAFNLNITSAKDSDGNLLSGNKTITVTSDQGDLSYNQAMTFANGAVMVPISLSKIGVHTLTVAINGVTPIKDLTTTVYSKLSFSAADTVSGYDAANGTEVVIAPDNNGTPVTAIGNGVFAKTDDEYTNNVQSITAVTIPASVTAIGASAFKNCKNLTNVTFTGTSKLETIGTDAFKSCITLTPFTIPASVITIGDGAFYSCTAFNIVTFADNSLLSSIGNSAFQACTMKTITIPASVTTIATLAFQMCPELTTVTFAEGSQLTTISDSTFTICPKLNTIQIPAKVITISSWAFHGCALLDTVTFETGSALKNINIYAFNACPLKTITNIPADVTIDPTAGTMGSNNAGFITIYNKIGGTYTYDSNTSTWSK